MVDSVEIMRNRHGGNERYAWSRDGEHGVGGM